jgi:hypothetical protein
MEDEKEAVTSENIYELQITNDRLHGAGFVDLRLQIWDFSWRRRPSRATGSAAFVFVCRKNRGPQSRRSSLPPYSRLTMSTEISTAGIVPLFSSQCRVFLSSGQPTPGP